MLFELCDVQYSDLDFGYNNNKISQNTKVLSPFKDKSYTLKWLVTVFQWIEADRIPKMWDAVVRFLIWCIAHILIFIWNLFRQNNVWHLEKANCTINLFFNGCHYPVEQLCNLRPLNSSLQYTIWNLSYKYNVTNSKA